MSPKCSAVLVVLFAGNGDGKVLYDKTDPPVALVDCTRGAKFHAKIKGVKGEGTHRGVMQTATSYIDIFWEVTPKKGVQSAESIDPTPAPTGNPTS